MKKPKDIFDEVYRNLSKEFKLKDIETKPRTLDEIEGMVERFGQEFKKKIIEKTVHEQRTEVD